MSDLKQYAQELFKKAGVSDDKAKLVLDALGDESVLKAFKDGFVETPQYHSNLDKLKGEYEPRVKAATDRVAAYDKWYTEQAQPAITNYQQAATRLKAYEDAYGPIDTNVEARRAATATGLTKEQVDEIVTGRERTMAQAFSSLTKDVAYATGDHLQRFKEPLDLDAVEKLAIEKGVPFRAAYNEYVAPKREAQHNSEIEAKIKAAREEGAKDALSKHQLPAETTPKEPMGFWDRKTQPVELTGRAAEQHSRNSFFEGWNNPEPAEAAK